LPLSRHTIYENLYLIPILRHSLTICCSALTGQCEEVKPTSSLVVYLSSKRLTSLSGYAGSSLTRRRGKFTSPSPGRSNWQISQVTLIYILPKFYWFLVHALSLVHKGRIPITIRWLCVKIDGY